MHDKDLEKELKKAGKWLKTRPWGKRQNNFLDGQTSKLVYSTDKFDDLLLQLQAKDESVQNYVMRRWYNFNVEKQLLSIFRSSPLVTFPDNKKNHSIDLYIDGIPFDLKTSVYPKFYKQPIEHAIQNPKDLIEKFYKNQSTEGRFHLENRLFIVYYSSDGDHNKLKGVYDLNSAAVIPYLAGYDKKLLHKIKFANSKALSDIIWVIK